MADQRHQTTETATTGDVDTGVHVGGGVDVDGLERLMDEMHALHVVALWHLLKGLLAYERAGALRRDGCRSAADYLVARFGMAYGLAKRYVSLARRLEALPALDRAVGQGRLAVDVAEAAARLATPDTDAEVTERALGWTAAEARLAARRAAPVTDDDDRQAERAATFRSWVDADGRLVRFSGVLPADVGAVLLAAIDREEAAAATAHAAAGELAPVSTRRAYALATLASARLGADAAPDRAAVTITVGHHDLHDAGGQGELDGLGVALSARKLALATCDCTRRAVVVDARGAAIGIGRASHSVPGWLRRQVTRRDGGFCQFPRCDSRRFLDCHHLVHWSQGGPTDLDNLALLCRFHHRWLHLNGLRLAARTGGPGFEVRDPTGQVRMPRGGGGLSPAVRARVIDPPPRPATRVA